MTRRTTFFVICGIYISFFCSCAFMFSNRLYSGPLRPRGEVAILANRDQGTLVSTIITAVDGQDDCSTKIVELLPGRHTLTVQYGGAVGYKLSAPLSYELQAEAGHTYVVYGTEGIDHRGKIWLPHVDDITDRLANPEWTTVKSAIDNYWVDSRP